jgi:hypothetical protein
MKIQKSVDGKYHKPGLKLTTAACLATGYFGFGCGGCMDKFSSGI